MKELDFSALAKQLTQSEFVCQLTREDIGDNAGLLTFLQSQPTPYFNYVLCVLDDDVRIHPVYVGYTNDLPGRMCTHARLVEFDVVVIYHAPDKETALANEQQLMSILGTKSLFNGALTQLGFVPRDQLLAGLECSTPPTDPVRLYGESDCYTRKTYYLTPVIVEALRGWCYREHLDVSEAIRIALVAGGIPVEHLESAHAACTSLQNQN